MAISIANVATQDKYADALTLGPIAECVGIKYVVANASVLAQTVPKSKSGTLPDWGDEVLITPESNTLQDCDGIRFRSATAGVPAQVVATLYLPADAKFGSGTPFTSKLSAAGAISGQVSTVLTGATIAALNTAAGASLVDGIPGRLQLGAAPYDFVDVVYNAALAKWVTAAQYYEGGEIENYTGLTTAAFTEPGRVGAGGIWTPDAPTAPWATYDAAGLKPQFRLLGGLSGDGSAAMTVLARFAYKGAPAAAVYDAAVAVPLSEVSITNAVDSLEEVDSFWIDIPGGYTVRSAMVLLWLGKTTSLGRGHFALTLGIRWVG